NPLAVFRLAAWIRESKPDVIHTWMYHANLVGGVAARLAGGFPVVWGIHHSPPDLSHDKPRTTLVNRACGLLSRKLPARIVCCSQSAIRFHEKLGYAAEKLEVVPNGFDLDCMKPEPAARTSLRSELGVSQDVPLVGIAGRFHPQKDYRNFIQ